METPFLHLGLGLLCLQALLGALDTIWHHELVAALPRRPGSELELAIHAARALLYGVLFLALAWFAWGGLWTLLPLAIFAAGTLLTLWDFVVEDRTRCLPRSERVLHTILALNAGAAYGLLALQLPAWWALPDGWIAVNHGVLSWLLTLAAAGVTASGLRDAWAAWALPRALPTVRLDLGRSLRILVGGGTGFIGSALTRRLLAEGHDVTLVSRRPIAAAVMFGARVRAVPRAAMLDAGERFDAVVNLAGAPIVGARWSRARRRELLASRLRCTRDLLDFAARAWVRPQVWLQASAIGYYGATRATPAAADESSTRGRGFAALLCHRWESLAARVDALGIRRVTLRLGLVLGRSGGALGPLLLPHRLGLGAVLGDGTQRFAWIHLEDLLRLMALALRDPSVRGTVNALAPSLPTQRDFARAAADLIGRPLWLRLPARLLRALLGEMASLFVDGPPIRAARLPPQFAFRYPMLRGALMDLV